jgi:predicted RNA-binding protein with PIN domain
MERVIIDGYNLMYKDGVLKNLAERSLEQARAALLDRIATYRSQEREIVVVFDGQGGSGETALSTSSGVRVTFSRPPRTADQVIVEMIARESKRASLTVVSSDKKDIGRIARAEGVKWISSESFWGRLRRSPAKKRTREEEKPLTTSSRELEYWLKRFGSDS